MLASRRSCLFILTLATVTACGGSGDEAGTDPSADGLHIVSGAGISDTVEAKPIQALIVEMRAGGKPRQGLVLRFQSLPSTDTLRWNEPPILLAPLASAQFSPLAVDSTDSSGRAKVLIQLGAIRGPARVLITCPELGLADTASFTVLPGAAARLTIRSRDTVLAQGGTHSIEAYASDRFGNRRSDPLTFVSASLLATVDAFGKVTAGQAPGRAAIAVRAGAAVDSVRLTIVPGGSLAFLYQNEFYAISVATSNVDGTNLTILTPASSTAYPSASPTSDLIAFEQFDFAGATVYIVDGTRTKRRLLSSNVMEVAANPRFSADGQYVYFTGRQSANDPASIWRVRPDGSALEKIVTSPQTYLELSQPAPSPDGSRLAYRDSRGIVVMTLATKAAVPVAFGGTFPVYSPDGRHLAYLDDGGVVVAAADGSGPTSFAPQRIHGDAGLAWLPDGKWLITRSTVGTLMLNATTGAEMPLGGLSRYYQISARP